MLSVRVSAGKDYKKTVKERGGITMTTRHLSNNHKLSRYVLPALLLVVLIDLVLGFSGIISSEQMKKFIYIPALLELIFIILGLVNIRRIVRRYRELKKGGRETMDAWQEALEIMVPPGVARLATIETRLYYALYLSYKGKPKTGEAVEFQTRLGNYELLVKAIIGLCVFEILLVSLMLPQRWMAWKIVHLVLGLWAVLWIWADYRAIRFYCHQVTKRGIRFRIGLRCCREIPWESIASINKTVKSSPGIGPQVFKEQPGSLYLGVGEPCNVEVELKKAEIFQGMINEIKDIRRLYLSVEKPDAFLSLAVGERRINTIEL